MFFNKSSVITSNVKYKPEINRNIDNENTSILLSGFVNIVLLRKSPSQSWVRKDIITTTTKNIIADIIFGNSNPNSIALLYVTYVAIDQKITIKIIQMTEK